MNRQSSARYSYWFVVWKQFKRRRLGMFAFLIVMLFCLVGVYAPFLASGKPLTVYYDGSWYFPLFRYLFYRGFFTKPLDLFFNLLIFTLPLFTLIFIVLKQYRKERTIVLGSLVFIHFALFGYLCYRAPVDPASDAILNKERQAEIQLNLKKEKIDSLLVPVTFPEWNRELKYMNAYAKLNLLLSYKQKRDHYQRLLQYEPLYKEAMKKRGLDGQVDIPVLWNLDRKNREESKKRQQQILSENEQNYLKAKVWTAFVKQKCQGVGMNRIDSDPNVRKNLNSSSLLYSPPRLPPGLICDFLSKLSRQDSQSTARAGEIIKKYESAQAKIRYLEEKHTWLKDNSKKLEFVVMPLTRSFHWEEDAGGSQELNRHVGWWDLTRINRKDMVAALIFGVRISLSVGLTAIGLALLIGIPIGAFSGDHSTPNGTRIPSPAEFEE